MGNVRDVIREKLNTKGATLKELSDAIGVSEAGLRKMLDRGTFKSDYMIKIAKFLDVDMTFFGSMSKQDTDNVKISKMGREDAVKELEALREVIATKDEVIRAKDELIATLREKLNTK